MKLVKPSIEYKDSYIEALEEGFMLGENKRYPQEVIAQAKENFEQYLQDHFYARKKTRVLCQDGKYHDRVPQDSLWLVDGDEFIGQFEIRHYLNSFLLQAGGHIGYGIRPSKRMKGYASKGLALTLAEVKNMRLDVDKVLITANDENIASWKVIEKNKGVLENIIQEPWGDKRTVRRYWVDV
ncbi:MAG: GNAT family N-acetyltransferase [Lactobacillus sp.]|jgi:predicted acetyltransferase|nr:GNAT family N-acetyltransferase [Lactobacillus sp.]